VNTRLDATLSSSALDSAVAVAAGLLVKARDVTLLAHVNPDADALGSALALGIALQRRGATVRVSFATPDRMPETLAPLDELGLVVEPAAVPAEPELLVCCDAAEPARLGTLADRLDSAGVSVMLDHHASNPGFGDVQVFDPTAEATVVLAHRVLIEMGMPLDADVARCLYAGLVTDTRGFRTAGATAHLLAAELVAAGVEPEALVRPLMDAHPFAWLAVLGRVLQGAVLETGAARGLDLVHAWVPLQDTRRFRVEEVDGVVDVLRTAQEAEVAAVLKQIEPARFAISLRSTGRVDVAAAAVRLGGGGHRAAAGCTVAGTRDEVLTALRAALAADPQR
jgi:bifunctional oligoribonuclease and PAP phosphatase NrnA